MPERVTQSLSSHEVVITGAAAVASLGTDVETLWRKILAGECGIGSMSEIESSVPTECAGGQAADLPADYRPDLPREARYLRWTVEHALRDAGVEPAAAAGASRRCAVLGTTLHGIRAGGRYLRSGNTADLSTFIASATSQLALEGLGLQGGAITTCSACSSSLGAIALGATLLESGQADMVIAGGYDAISEYAWAGFNALRLIANGPLRPFCRDRQGMKVAEGYGIVVLERVDSASRRGQAPRAILAGWGESADSHHLTQPHPQGEGALAAMRQALNRARIPATELGMVAAHATGTPDNDGAEYHALSRLLGEDLSNVPVVGFKSFLGHTLGGAGAVELVMSCMALRDQSVPACPNVDAGEIEYPGLNVASGKRAPHAMTSTLNTSLGFGGANTCVVLSSPRSPAQPRAFSQLSDAPPESWITGIGIVLPGAVGLPAFIARVQRAVPSTAVSRTQTIDDADLAGYLNVRRARRMSQYVKLTLAAAAMAVRDAGLADHPNTLANASAVLGTMHGSASFCAEYYSQIVREGALAANPVLFAEGVPNAAAAHLSAAMGVKGACQTIIGSRTAGLDALALAALRVRSGAASIVLVVAAEAPCDVVDQAYINLRLQMRRKSNAVDSMDTSSSGFMRSFGGVAFIIESGRAAADRRAIPYARVIDSACGSAPARGSVGASRSVASVLKRLPAPGRIIGSACRTWVDRAERIGMRRAGVLGEAGAVHEEFGELFSVTPLVGIASELVSTVNPGRFSSLCTDWSGAASAVSIERLDRRASASARSSEARP